MKIAYEDCRMRASGLALVAQVNAICTDMVSQGYSLTLRQTFYQLVTEGLIPNTTVMYNKLGRIVSDARLCGLIDWEHIEDRTRNPVIWDEHGTPQEEMDNLSNSYHLDRWTNSEYRVEIYVEKEALAGVVERPAADLGVSYFSCRGYVSQSEMWRAGRRLAHYARNGQTPVVLHLGDHDPSGIDMSRDIQERLATFMGAQADHLVFKRIALNMDQIEQYNPPPNPARVTDSRFAEYQQTYGDESWELDALNAATLTALIEEEVEPFRDHDAEAEIEQREDAIRERLRRVSDRWEEIAG